jgi:hypothetical protein
MTIPPKEKVYRSFLPSAVEIRGATFLLVGEKLLSL